ncbi:MAG TPA: AAA family ATPase [Terriglobia bacterium]|jgi:DNA-binding winged helix-turn-helix (wHTH) protein
MLTQRQIFEFDNFRVDTGQFILTKAGRSTPITPTVFKILVALLERAGEIVTKEQLMKQVWPDSFVEEGNLNRNISTLRKALGERPKDHKYVETVPKTGYRFIATVRSSLYEQAAAASRTVDSGTLHHVVGRDEEKKQLRSAYDLARDGHGGVVAVSGDVGLGKTALVDVFLQDLIKDGETFHLARSRCSESLIEVEPFMPWIEALSAIAKTPSIAGIMQNTAPTWHREISHTGSGCARRMKRELLDFCSELPPAHPLVVVIDDFQFSDNGSVDLLTFLATRLESTHTLVIICYRLVEMKIRSHPFLGARSDLLSRGVCAEIQLPFLGRKDIEQHMAQNPEEGKATDEYLEFVHAKTEGNPLFVRELLRHRDSRSGVIHNLIEAKLSRLDDTHRQLLVTASVQGREFDSAVLAMSMHLNPQDVEESFHELHDVHGLVNPIREEQLADGRFTVRYRFVYAFCQEACYASLAPTRKAALSAALAEAFLTYYGN